MNRLKIRSCYISKQFYSQAQFNGALAPTEVIWAKGAVQAGCLHSFDCVTLERLQAGKAEESVKGKF